MIYIWLNNHLWSKGLLLSASGCTSKLGCCTGSTERPWNIRMSVFIRMIHGSCFDICNSTLLETINMSVQRLWFCRSSISFKTPKTPKSCGYPQKLTLVSLRFSFISISLYLTSVGSFNLEIFLYYTCYYVIFNFLNF